MTRNLRGAIGLLAIAGCIQASQLSIQLLGWKLLLQENQAIRSPFYDACKFYKGHVIDERESSVTLTDCEGTLYGLIHVGNEEYVVEPKDSGHKVHRRDVTISELAPAYNLTGDTVDALDLNLDEEVPIKPYVRSRYSNAPELDYFRDALPVERPVSGDKGLWLELAIVADHTMVKFHGKTKVKHYILALMNIVSAIFNDASLSSNMTLVINKLYLYEEQDSIIKYGEAKKSLESVNRWNNRHLIKLSPGGTGWDATIWLTKEDLGGPSGFAAVGGVCSRKRSAAIDRDEGLTSAFVIAHELGHLLGLTHDGLGECKEEPRVGSVMAPTVVSTLYNYTWSSCSKKQFHEKSKNWACLHYRSSNDGIVMGGTKELHKFVFTMEEQCRTEFGEGYSVCKSMDIRSSCSRLLCAHKSIPNVCQSKKAPPLEGTPCKKHHWCVDGVCEPGFTTKPKQRSVPRWSDWSSWSTCKSDCGYGLKTRSRYCEKDGVIENEACEGATTQAVVCWTGKECVATRDTRSDMCRRHSPNFIPYVVKGMRECDVWCINYNGIELANYGTLPDGVPCGYDRNHDLCFQGTCVKGHCNSSDTTCNWCHDGFCNNNSLDYTRKLTKGWTRLFMVPHNAHQTSIHITTPLPIDIALRERHRDKPMLRLSQQKSTQFQLEQDRYLKYDVAPENLRIVEIDKNVIDFRDEKYGVKGTVVAAGTVLEWNQTNTDVFITAASQIHSDLMILATLVNSDNLDNPVPVQVSLNYSTPSSYLRSKEYRWKTERGPCSVSCGGGIRLVRTQCVDEQICPKPRLERCNVHKCHHVWLPGEWEECSATCGDNGYQERQIYCLPADFRPKTTKDLIDFSVSPALCGSEKPLNRQSCNRIQCPVYWKEMPWTACSTSCGRGISIKPLYCPAENDAYCGRKPIERKRRCRIRRCPVEVCKSSDTSKYCELFTYEELERYCDIPYFKKYCCQSCKEFS